jgi:hypothetical protein
MNLLKIFKAIKKMPSIVDINYYRTYGSVEEIEEILEDLNDMIDYYSLSYLYQPSVTNLELVCYYSNLHKEYLEMMGG